MDLGYDKSLFILAFDHRNTFAEHMFETTLEAFTTEQHQQVCDFKMMIYEGFQKSLLVGVPKDNAAILVDEEFGDAVLQRAKLDGVTTILTVEKSGQKEVAFAYGDQFAEHIEKYMPTFAKVLIKYNPNDVADSKQRQQAQLKILSDYCQQHKVKFLLEPLVPPTQEQLASVNNDKDHYDRKIRPTLTVQMIKEFQDAGIEIDIWKLEGFFSKENYVNVVNQARANGRNHVSVVVLGRGASKDAVELWIRTGAMVEGVVGFAVGRTIFWDALSKYYHQEQSKEQAIGMISDNFSYFVNVFQNAHDFT